MRSLVVLGGLVACGRGHHEPIAMSTEMHAQLTSIADDSCSTRHAETQRPLEQCVNRDGRIRVWLLLDAGGLRGISYELNLTPSEDQIALRRAVQGIIDDGLLETLCADLQAGSPGWREGRDVRGLVHISSGTRVVEIRWMYL
jgi:hypothetical protein